MDGATSSMMVGLLGVTLYLRSYAALQAGILPAYNELYPLLNIAAAACVLLDLQRTYNLPSVLIQISWIIISLAGLYRLRRRHRLRKNHRRRLHVYEKDYQVETHLQRSLFRMETEHADYINLSQWQESRHMSRMH